MRYVASDAVALDGCSPSELSNSVQEYAVPCHARDAYENEILQWQRNGWLLPYSEELGPPKGLISLMAIVQKQKVRPVLDYRELNGFVDAFIANAEVHVDKVLWLFQTVIFRGQCFCLVRLGFGLNVAPLMKSVIDAIVSQDCTIKGATSAYVDDILINESLVSVSCVQQHFLDYGLVSKDLVWLRDEARVLGLQVWKKDGTLWWKWGSQILEIPDGLTRQHLFSFCVKLVGHFPICGWVAVAFIKHLATAVTKGWNDRIKNTSLCNILAETLTKVQEADPIGENWCMDGKEKWKKGKLSLKNNWSRFVMNVTHHNGENFLTIINCGPSRFAIWWPLHRQDAHTDIWQLENVFLERSLLMEILTNNNTAFISKDFREFVRNWDVHLRFRCAYSPSGNGIVEWSHRTVMSIAARKNCSILEAVYWRNVTLKDDVSPCTAPADALHGYHVWIKGVEDNPLPEPVVTCRKYEKGYVVWVKNPCGKCTKYSTGRVTEVISLQSVKIDGVPRHVKDLWPVIWTQLSSSDESNSEDSECLIYLNSNPLDSDSDASNLPTDEVSIETQTTDKSTHEGEACVIPLRRSTQQRWIPPPCSVCDHEIGGGVGKT